ncbi:TIR domain-containing protein [Streptomyces murinus]|uniref:TIR domain-containing protein n=1 Tax=Streptomyces murinus TaxID=33900 RepID=UPI000A375360|nr:TIR domain-containing protein [Streptomyces murinus]
MARKVFFSFRYKFDSWRVQTVKNMGRVEGQPLLTSNEWEDVARNGDAAIQRWIDGQMAGKSCDVVLIGSQTAGRPWVEYEFKKAWQDGKGVVGIHIHRLLDQNRQSAIKGRNPFSGFTLNDGRVAFDQVVRIYDPAGYNSNAVYSSIAENIEAWVEEAISIRKQW